jgi:DNA-binding SARP family transcriptional activator
MSPWLRVLGDFALHDRHDTFATGTGGERLLAYLAVRGGPVPRAHAAGALWGRSTAERASSNLRAVLCRLPRPGGRSLVTATGRHLRLADDVVVDLASARAAIERVRAGGTAGVHDAVAGDLSADLSADLLPGWDEDWLVVEREHHRQRRLHALEALSAVLCRQRRFDEALGAALASVAGEPLRESSHRRVIEVHLAEGNPAEALRQYERYRRLVRDELGLAPTGEIRALVARLLGRPADGAA